MYILFFFQHNSKSEYWLYFCVTGSGQQSVTGVTAVEDSNSYWSVRGTSDTFCQRGTPVKCGQTIRLTHVNTGRNLHSHYFSSPLSSNQVGAVTTVILT